MFNLRTADTISLLTSYLCYNHVLFGIFSFHDINVILYNRTTQCYCY